MWHFVICKKNYIYIYCVCVRACVRACMRACVRACVRVFILLIIAVLQVMAIITLAVVTGQTLHIHYLVHYRR